MKIKLAVAIGIATVAALAIGGGSPSAGVFPGAPGKIIFESSDGIDNEVFSINADGSGRAPVTSNAISDGTASFSGDGERIVFTTDGTIAVMDASGSNVTPLNVTTGDDPSFSPDGKQIVFTNNDGGGDLEIYVMNADGSNQRPLTANAAQDGEASWSPDGQRIAFVRGDGTDDEVLVMNADGSNQLPLTSNAVDDAEPSWSPDGAKVLFTRDDGDLEIFTMNPDGTNATPLTANAIVDEDPIFSPDGQRVAFVRDDGIDNEIYLMNADGSNQVPLTANAVGDEDPDWQALNPPACVLSGNKKQKSFRFVATTITCSEDASVALSGTGKAPKVASPRGARAVPLKSTRFALVPQTIDVQPDVPTPAKLAIPKKARRALKKASKGGKAGRATVIAIAIDDLTQTGQATAKYTFKKKRKK